MGTYKMVANCDLKKNNSKKTKQRTCVAEQSIFQCGVASGYLKAFAYIRVLQIMDEVLRCL